MKLKGFEEQYVYIFIVHVSDWDLPVLLHMYLTLQVDNPLFIYSQINQQVT